MAKGKALKKTRRKKSEPSKSSSAVSILVSLNGSFPPRRILPSNPRILLNFGNKVVLDSKSIVAPSSDFKLRTTPRERSQMLALLLHPDQDHPRIVSVHDPILLFCGSLKEEEGRHLDPETGQFDYSYPHAHFFKYSNNTWAVFANDGEKEAWLLDEGRFADINVSKPFNELDYPEVDRVRARKEYDFATRMLAKEAAQAEREAEFEDWCEDMQRDQEDLAKFAFGSGFARR
ncbi:hypothetical protein BDY24DRAFT_438004 [Mrakia frigida]|uniref:uncharacterized protein n=1 Tax=Mrakia frigida TaxID=29902 RepID=UPI003FCC211D